jgi:hypothetical protein
VTTANPTHAHGLSDRLHYLPIGIGAAVLQALMMIPGYNQDGEFDTAWFGMLAVALVLAIGVFALAVPHGGGTTAVVLGVLAVLGCVAFWAMLSFPLAAGAAIVGMRARQTVAEHTRGTVGVALAAFAVVATVAITIADMIAGD